MKKFVFKSIMSSIKELEVEFYGYSFRNTHVYHVNNKGKKDYYRLKHSFDTLEEAESYQKVELWNKLTKLKKQLDKVNAKLIKLGDLKQ